MTKTCIECAWWCPNEFYRDMAVTDRPDEPWGQCRNKQTSCYDMIGNAPACPLFVQTEYVYERKGQQKLPKETQ